MTNMKRPTGIFVAVLVGSVLLYLIMTAIQPALINNSLIPDYNYMMDGIKDGNPISWILWFFGDMTEPNYYKAYLGGVGLIIGSIIAFILNKNGSRHQGIAIAYGSGLWPWVLGSSALSLILAMAMYGWNIPESGWFPTFVVFVSVPAATVLSYGPGWKNLITGAVAGAIVVVPLSRLVITYFATPLGLPSVLGSVFGMWFGGAICFEIYNCLQWMKLPEENDTELPVRAVKGTVNDPEYRLQHPNKFFIRRLIADFSEPIFAGNEIAGAGLIIGTVLSWLLCPDSTVYAESILPVLLLGEFVTGAVSIYVYWDHWMTKDWFSTFPSMVSVAPGIAVVYDGNFALAMIAAVAGALICPPIADFIISRGPKHWPPLIGNTCAMTMGTLIVGMMCICIKGLFGV